MSRSARGPVLAAAAAFAFAIPAVAPAGAADGAHVAKKSYRVSWFLTLDPGNHGVRLPGSVKSGSPFGKGRVDGQITSSSSASYIFTFKGGKIKASASGLKTVNGFANGKFHFISGTGKFRGITGSGSVNVNFHTTPTTSTIKARSSF